MLIEEKMIEKIPPTHTLHSELAVELAWLRQMLAQLYDEKPKTMPYEPDAVGHIKRIEAFRPKILDAGIEIPKIVDAISDPLGAMAGWRDFLTRIITEN